MRNCISFEKFVTNHVCVPVTKKMNRRLPLLLTCLSPFFSFFLYFSRIIRSLSDVWYRVTNRDKKRSRSYDHVDTAFPIFPPPLIFLFVNFLNETSTLCETICQVWLHFYLARCYRKRVKYQTCKLVTRRRWMRCERQLLSLGAMQESSSISRTSFRGSSLLETLTPSRYGR